MNHTATLLTDGRVLVTAGNKGGIAHAKVEIYDPATGLWTPASDIGGQRESHTATLLLDGRVLVTGGQNSSHVEISTAQIYDPGTGIWIAAAPMSTARAFHTAALLANGRVLVAGGSLGGSPLASAEIYDPATNSWTPAASMSVGRSGHLGAVLLDGRILVAGGFNGSTYEASVEIYDPAIASWTLAASMIIPRWSQTGTLLSDGRVLVTGGFNGSAYEATAEAYDPAADVWLFAGSMSTPRSGHTAAVLSGGGVLVAGGANLSGRLSSTEIYDPASGTWALADSMNLSRIGHTATPLFDGRVLIAGGRSTIFWLNSAEIFSQRDSQTITFGALSDKMFSDAPFEITATASSGLPVSFGAAGSCSIAGTTVTITGVGSCTITASQSGNAAFSAAPTVSRAFNIAKATPTLTWSNPGDITYGTALGAAQLNAVVSGPAVGTLEYTPSFGTILNAGPGQVLSVTFTPSNTTNFNSVTKTVQISVQRATQAGLTATAPGSLTYGNTAALTSSGGSGTGAVTFGTGASTGCAVAGSQLSVTNASGTCAVTASKAADNNYSPATSAAAAVTLSKATPTINATGGTFNYDHLPHPATGSSIGVNNENLGAPIFNYTPGDASAPVEPGVYSAVASFTGSDNYAAATSTAATITIQYLTGGTCLGEPGHQTLQPINADGSSVFKQKSTVPTKFRVCDANGTSVGTPGVVRELRLIQTISGTATADVNEVVNSIAPDTTFRWDSSAQQWIYNIDTKNLSTNNTYVYRITLRDGSTIQFQYGLK